ncbi:MAG: cell surface protein SprA, partial [Sphingobacteriaceae bacterium]
EEYFQYHVDLRPAKMIVGQNFITDKITSQVKLVDGTTTSATWYQFRIPINEYESTVGDIQDFKSIRFIRMFMTNFADTAVMRFATLQLVRGEWRAYNRENNILNVIADPAILNPTTDNKIIDVQAVNIEENGNRTPIPYVVPPGIQRQRNYNNLKTNTQLNEQSLSLYVDGLRDGYSKAAFKTFYNDLRSYKKLQVFVHAEGPQLKDHDVSAFMRLGVDYRDNYYEYEVPLKVTLPGTRDPGAIWPAENEIQLELALLTRAKLARNKARFDLNKVYTYTENGKKVLIKGQPDLSRLRTIMLGIRNPLKLGADDDGLDKTATVWYDELRLTDFDQRGGWAAAGRMNAKLADFADVTISGTKSTIGFGSIDSRVSERSRSDNQSLDVAANVELGKFFPDKAGIHIPAYINISTQKGTPQYDPTTGDVELKDVLANEEDEKRRDTIKRIAEDYTIRKSVNFTNVHKTKTDPDAKNYIWDVENLNFSYAYTEYQHRDFVTELDLQKTYRLALAYNYSNQPKYYEPLSKVIKSKLLTIFKDINYSILPTRLNFSVNYDRFYSENTVRTSPNPAQPISLPTNTIATTYNRSFNITRVYGLGWNLSKSLQMDIDATNLSVIDEPADRINGLKQNILWENISRLGRNTNYSHTLTFGYTTPINKLPYLDWTSAIVRYSTHFNWQSQPEFAIKSAEFDVGNSIQNGRTIQVNPTLNLIMLYNRFPFIRNANKDKDGKDKGGNNFWIGLLTSIKSISGNYQRTETSFLPGYLPLTDVFGQDLDYNAPGIGFVLGSQADIRKRAVLNGWLSRDTLQNQLYVTTYSEDLRLKGTIEPIKDLRIELIAFRTQDRSFQTNFKFVDDATGFKDLSPVTTGNYSVSFLSLATAFKKESGVNNVSGVFQQFLRNRVVVSQRLGATNPNSTGPVTTPGFAPGYGPNSQDVLVTAFIAAYTGKNAGGYSLDQFPSIPIPNWQLNYSGLSRIPFLSQLFDSFDIRHGYRSSYNVNGYTTLLQYGVDPINGMVNTKDIDGDFLPFYQFSQVTILEQFVPLFGVDARFKNSMTANFEYRKSRSLALSLLNSQLAQQTEDIVVLGFGYRTTKFRFPFGLFKTKKDNNDMNFKLDVALRDNKTLIYRADVESAEVSSGAKNITFRPTIDYVINQRFNLNIFYDTNITKPYTSQSFNTSFTNFGVNLKLLLQ